MKFKVRTDAKTFDAEGWAAFGPLRKLMRGISANIILPEPPYTAKARKRAYEALRRGEWVSDRWSDDGTPCGEFIIRKL